MDIRDCVGKKIADIRVEKSDEEYEVVRIIFDDDTFIEFRKTGRLMWRREK